MKPFRFVSVLLLPLVAVSCKSTKDSSPYEDPYVANFGNDGGYNPYPDSGGYASTPSYDTPPVDEYAFTAPKPAPSSSTSTYTPKPAPKPTPKPTPKPAAKPKPKVVASRTHTVTKGETLYGLARKYGSTVAKIKSANGLSGDMIRIGQKLKIP